VIDLGRRVARLTLDNLAELPSTCANCVFWEHPAVRRAQVCDDAAEEKAAWLSEVLREWGSCGRIVYVDEEPVGHLIWAPPVWVPGADGFATAPVSNDAVLLTTGYVAPSQRGFGVGRLLIQAMAKDLLTRGGIRAVEAFGDTRASGGASERDCVLPTDFLLGVGFKTHRPHPTYPRMRMDLRSALTWREEFEVALDRLLGAVHPSRQPAPARPTQRSPREVR
jgi:GNAT superfamily N-acetyltransferase